MRHVLRGGFYYRVCKPDWVDCSDAAFSQIHGGRWNPPGPHAALYLNRTEHLAALQAIENFRGEAHSLFDLRPERRPDLSTVEVPATQVVDAVTGEGLEALGLPASYPDGCLGRWDECQVIGEELYGGGEPGIACRSACPGAAREDEELAWFVREGRGPVESGERRRFGAWFPRGEI